MARLRQANSWQQYVTHHPHSKSPPFFPLTLTMKFIEHSQLDCNQSVGDQHGDLWSNEVSITAGGQKTATTKRY
jgi:hypothetical protein